MEKIKKPLFFLCMIFLNSCTYNISMVHTQGTAEDVIDSNQSAEPDISPEISIPAI
ncbi:MAG TPA: hypothetical protein VFO37_04775 [Chitinophagaceae bacterium]|nr:hypothetical protein [Chitinophagaceae bacterium]